MAINKKRLQGAAETTALVPSENFDTVIYTGNSASGVTQSISVGFQPDLIWFKNRTGTNFHAIVDSVRTRANYVYPNDTLAENDGPASAAGRDVASFDTNGFTVGQTSVASSTNEGSVVAWSWKAGTTSNNTQGNITSVVSANQAAGFSIVKYTTAGSKIIGHGLSQAPELIIQKRTDVTSEWVTYTATTGLQKYLQLQSNADVVSDANFMTAVGASTFTSQWSSNSHDYINYCFHSVSEYSKISSYTGNNSTSNIVNCGFEPAWLLVKRTDADANWRIVDNTRNTTNPRNSALYPSLPNAEYTNAVENVNFTTTGFEIATTDTNWNASGGTYLFYAIAADPDTTTPTLAKSFNVDTYTGNGATQQIGSVNTLFTKYAVFNGSNSKIDLPNFMPSGNAARTVSMWIKTTQTSAATLFQYGGGNTDLLFNFRINDGGAGGGSNTIGIGFYANDFNRPATTLMDGNWHNVITTYDSTNAKIYIDGVQTGADFATGGVNTTATAAIIGSDGGTFLFNGSIDQVRMFNTAIDQAAVTQLYNETQASASTLNFPTGLGGLALYEFNDDGDDTGGNYDATSVANITYDSFLFKPDLTIIKGRETNGKEWGWFDTLRGVKRMIRSNSTAAEIDYTDGLTEFNNAGFTVGDGGDVNTSGEDYVSYSFKMLDNNNNVPIENTVGTINSLTSVNAEAGMSIAKYIGNGTQNATIGHGLTSSPDMVIIKNLDQSDSWFVSHSGLSSNQFMELDNVASATDQNPLNHTRNSTTFQTTGTTPHHMFNASGENYIMYSFITTSTFSHFGSYDGDNGTDRLFNIGFAANFVMVKKSNGNSNWQTFDSIRGGNAQVDFNSSAEEYTGGSTPIEFVSNGFKIKSNYTTYNATGGEYIYWAMKIN